MSAHAYAGDERVLVLKKKPGNALTNWSIEDAAAPGALDAILIKGGPVNPERKQAKGADESQGSEHPQDTTYNKGVSVALTLKQYLRYSGTRSHLGLAMALGTSAGTPTLPNAATGALTRDQVFTPALNINGLVASILEGATASRVSDQPSCSIVPSAMCRGFTLRGAGDDTVELESRWVGIDVFLKPAPSDDPLPSGLALNGTLANIAAATLDDTSDTKVRMGDLAVYVDEFGGATDFASEDGEDYIVQVGAFDLNFERDIAYPDYGSQAGDALDNVSRPVMPVNNKGHIKPTGSFELLRYDSDVWKGRSFANIPLRMRWEWVGGEIETGYSYRFRLDFPRIKLIDAPKKVGGNTRSTCMFEAFQAPSIPTGFSSVDKIRAALRNKATADLLA